jgi:para-aminobenzoate synthetase/4-amino-4-deoxychorismate lyase
MAEPFELLETIRWTPDGGFFLLDRHLRRIEQSAAYFNYQCSTSDLRSHLEHAVAGSSGAQRVRLLLSRNGDTRVECTTLGSDATARTATLVIAASPSIRAIPFSSTRRQTARYLHARRPDCDDVVLWNPDRQVTESRIANVVVDIGGRKVTPPVHCGLLAGTFRAELLESGEIQESIVTLDELQAASALWLINSVRGWWPATLHRDR